MNVSVPWKIIVDETASISFTSTIAKLPVPLIADVFPSNIVVLTWIRPVSGLSSYKK